MRIDRLEVKGFGKLSDRTISLSKGINILYGSNEAGKSTLQWFIKGMFYGWKGPGQPRTGPMQPKKRFSPWNGGQYGGALIYTLDDGSAYRIERDFENDSVRLFDRAFQDIAGQFEKGRDRLSAFAERQLGMDETAFERTVLIRQMELRLDGDSSAALAGRLANAGSSGFDDISFLKAEKALADALKNNVGTGRTTVQPLDRMEARLKQLGEEQSRLLGQQERRGASRAELRKLRESRMRLEAERSYLEKIGELVGIRKTLDLDLSREAGLKEAVKLLKELEGSQGGEAYIAGHGFNSSVRVVTTGSKNSIGSTHSPGNTAAAESRHPSVSEHSADRNPTGSSRTPEDARWYRSPLPYLALALLFFIPAILLTLAGEKDFLRLIIPVCAAGTLSAGTAAFFAFRGGKPGASHFRADGKDNITSNGNGTGTWNPGLELESQMKSICSKASLLTGKLLDAPAAVRREWKDTAERLEELSGRLDAGIEEASSLEDRISRTASIFNPAELDTVLYDGSVENLESAWIAETDRVSRELLDASLNEKYLEGLLKEEQSEKDDLQRVEEETVAVMEKIAYLKNRGEALKLALEVLKEAGLEIRRTFAPGLDAKMSSIITALTAGRYSDLRGSDKLSLRVAAPEGGDVRDALLLSGAAADQMYLALRLALADIFTDGGESLPLLMDEVFSQLDDNRTALALQYLKNAYEKGQVLIFTCKRREVELAREICGEGLNLVEL